jgi:hypothetical protein
MTEGTDVICINPAWWSIEGRTGTVLKVREDGRLRCRFKDGTGLNACRFDVTLSTADLKIAA